MQLPGGGSQVPARQAAQSTVTWGKVASVLRDLPYQISRPKALPQNLNCHLKMSLALPQAAGVPLPLDTPAQREIPAGKATSAITEKGKNYKQTKIQPPETTLTGSRVSIFQNFIFFTLE